MEELLKDVFKGKKFQYIIFRSLLYSVLLIIMANEYYTATNDEPIGSLLFTLMSFFLIYTFYLRREINNAYRRKKRSS